MKFYSEILDQLFDTKEELLAEEKKREEQSKIEAQLKEEQEKRTKEIEDAIDEIAKAKERLNTLIEAFLKDYGLPMIFM